MLDKRIIKFINEHHLLTLSTVNKNIPYCCNVFYVYNEISNSLIFSSDSKTKHVQDFIENPRVAGSIAIETRKINEIQGLQLLGDITEPLSNELTTLKSMYINAFPYASNMQIHLWEMNLNFIKMTHNQLGFGNKLIWEK